MKNGQSVKIKKTGEIGVLNFVDNPWNLPDGSPADILCKVSFPHNSHGVFFRQSELELSTEKIVKEKKNMKSQIEFSEFLEIEKKLEIKLGSILEVERVPKSEKLLKLKVSFGVEERTVVTNIGDKVDPEILNSRQFPFITNLKPAKMMGIESTAMIMVPTHEDDTLDFETVPLSGSKLL
jgi:methionine--tRNA ligase beta chain